MTHFLIRHFIRDPENIHITSVRTAYGILSSVVGILCNLLLFTVKLLIGLSLNSVAVMADAFNNFSDAGSSIISFVGVRMAGKPADKDHPFGHGRIEYIAALIVAFLVIEVGFTFFKDSLTKIFHPEDLSFQTVSILILILSIGMKLWLGSFNRTLGKKIDSKVILAAAADSIGDVITTSVTILSIFIFHFFHINVDGLIGLLVACIIMWAGVGIAKDTLEPLIGAPADPILCQKIVRMVESYDGIIGSHDLIVHNYGPNRSMASIHAEVPREIDVNISHEIIDKAEREVSKKLGLLLVIHMDPVETQNEKFFVIREEVEKTILSVDKRLSFHDFRLVDGTHQINLIFDLVIPPDYVSKETVQKQVEDAVCALDSRYRCMITIDTDFVSYKN